MLKTKLTSKEELNQQIALLKLKQVIELEALNLQYKTTVEELSFSKIVSSSVSNLLHETKLNKSIATSLLSIVSGIFSKKIIVGKSNSVLKSILGATIQYITTKLVASKIEKQIK